MLLAARHIHAELVGGITIFLRGIQNERCRCFPPIDRYGTGLGTLGQLRERKIWFQLSLQTVCQHVHACCCRNVCLPIYVGQIPDPHI